MILMVFPHLAVADTALLIREGGGGVLKIFFLALLASIWPKNKAGWGGAAGPPPWIRHCLFSSYVNLLE